MPFQPSETSPSVKSLIALSSVNSPSSDPVKPKLHLYTQATPNGYKVSILLEELLLAYPGKSELAYDYTSIRFDTNEQKSEDFLKINPNGRIPALVDDSIKVKGVGHRVFESASIMLWLVEKYDKDNIFWFDDPVEKSEALSWIFFIHGGVGPMQGQANHFYRYAPEKIPYGIKRYQEETNRLYSVMEDGLRAGGGEWLVGNKFSIVDMNAYGWVSRYWWAGATIEHTPLLASWIDRITAREGVDRGVSIPRRGKTREEMEGDAAEAEARKNAAWILKK
ncbi:hypothetical protein M231_03268 [Tremella mesenterica]|uniref:Glutathione S-transferase n=1 Tax=Tremella mesenterica TaxID=5217 RepID=A0A4Q1BNI7_TREME|nr:hypothetical protein M231_03268 [Tremella mesenterica]